MTRTSPSSRTLWRLGGAVVAIVVVGVAAAGVMQIRATGQSLTEKERLMEYDQRPARKDGPAKPTDDPVEAASVDSTPLVLDVGLFEDGEAPISSSEFVGVNRWHGVVDGERVTVYAGAAGEDQSKGRVIMSVRGGANVAKPDRGKRFDLPDEGAVRLESVDGDTALIRGRSGKLHKLNLRTADLSS